MAVVEVKGLSKKYGTQLALDNLSFSLEKGTIMGLLGSNGAGKTTTMKILACFLPQSSGEAMVCGMDVRTHANEIKKNIGYLPENNPLYGTMYVKEYLNFVAGIHKIDNKKSRIEEIIQLTGLEKEQHKQLGDLSKGYKQRVGLSQALIHDPEVLILDEPTSGLDPLQLKDMRALIREIGKEKTIIFSSHIMQEIDALCDEVLILHEGQKIVHDTIDELKRTALRNTILVEFDKLPDEKSLTKISNINGVQILDNNWLRLECKDVEKAKREVFEFCKDSNLVLKSMKSDEASMEEIFLENINSKK